jgi:hypothetical protein
MSVVVIVVNAITVIELKGINIAAKSGDNVPCTAKLNPMILYIKEISSNQDNKKGFHVHIYQRTFV